MEQLSEQLKELMDEDLVRSMLDEEDALEQMTIEMEYAEIARHLDEIDAAAEAEAWLKGVAE